MGGSPGPPAHRVPAASAPGPQAPAGSAKLAGSRGHAGTQGATVAGAQD